MNSTVICHFYNEEYLLPFWLMHHKDIFDHGILIDYRSTDTSVEIIKKIVPKWEVISSVNKEFKAQRVDEEVMAVERKIKGIKICLNITEFLICKNLKKIFDPTEKHVFAIERVTMVQKWDFFKKIKNPIWSSRYYGFRGDNKINGLYRFVHNCSDGQYTLGRHSTLHNHMMTEDAIILWYGFSPFNLKVVKRKLQIKSKIPKSDFSKGYGFQHNVKLKSLLLIYIKQHFEHKVVNLKSLIRFHLEV
jgi:hypothetical protein